MTNRSVKKYIDMSPRTEKQFEQIRKEKRGLIMNAALELFAKEGYHQTSISKIAKSANISKGLLYNYFESKEELLKQIVLDGTMQMYEFFDPDHDGVLSDDEFRYYIEHMFSMLKENTSFWKLYYSLMMQPEVFGIVQPGLGDIAQKMSGILYNYFVNTGCDNPKVEMMLFSATVKGASMTFVTAPEFVPIDEVVEGIIKKYSNY